MNLATNRAHSLETLQNVAFDNATNAFKTRAVTAKTGATIVTEVLSLTITGTGATATLSSAPVSDTEAFAHINEGNTYDSMASSGFAVTGTAVVLANALLGVVLITGDRVVATYESSAGTFNLITEQPTVTLTAGGGTFSLANSPADVNQVIAYIDGKAVDSASGSGLQMIGAAGTFTNSLLGTALVGGERVVLKYYTDPTAQETVHNVEVTPLTITATGAIFTLSGVPANGTNVVVYLDGEPIDSGSGSGLVVTGISGTLSNAILGITIDSSMRAVAEYSKVI